MRSEKVRGENAEEKRDWRRRDEEEDEEEARGHYYLQFASGLRPKAPYPLSHSRCWARRSHSSQDPGSQARSQGRSIVSGARS